MKRSTIKELSGDAIDVMPRDYDWGTGYPEVWESYEAQRCEECGAIFVTTGGDTHTNLDNDSECDGYVPQSEGPMMNYWYPLPAAPSWYNEGRFDYQQAARKLVDLPLCIVQFQESGDFGLALTGGGQDRSWELCEAFMLLGYVPPLHYCRLPARAGKTANARNKWIVAGCRCAAQVAIRRARWVLQDLRNLSKKLE